ncbi:hypothetical protein [Rhizocola hellebori]|nr:hypothetical protein [Rhizocola hellebori]
MADSFPVLSEHALEPVGLGWSRLRQREVTLPPTQPGTVRVFAVKGRYLPEPGQAKVRAATSVSIVDMSPRLVQVSIEMTPPPGAIACQVRVSFRCQVVEPAAVAQLHLHDLQSALDGYLAQSSRLRRLAAPSSPDRLHETYLLIQQRISAQFSVQPPEIPGMRIELGFVKVDVS